MAPPPAPSRAMPRRPDVRMDVVGDIVGSIVSLNVESIYLIFMPIGRKSFVAGYVLSFNLCWQLSVLMHSSFSISRSTSFPPIKCESMISSRSAARTPLYQTASGYTTILGPWSHWSRHPALLARKRCCSPRALSLSLNCFCSSPLPLGLQHPRLLDASP